MSLATDFDTLSAEWARTFGGGLPLAQLPADEDQAEALIRQALAERSTRVIDELTPPDAAA